MFRIIFGGAALLAIVLVVVMRSPSPVVAAIPMDESSSPDFDAAWRDTEMVIALRKGDMIRTATTSSNPKSVSTEYAPMPTVEAPSIVPPVIASVPVVEPQETSPERRHAKHSNICTRHGMHKVSIRGGRSWRCRRR